MIVGEEYLLATEVVVVVVKSIRQVHPFRLEGDFTDSIEKGLDIVVKMELMLFWLEEEAI